MNLLSLAELMRGACLQRQDSTTENLVEQAGNTIQEIAKCATGIIQKVRNGAEQIAQQVARTRHRCDVEVDWGRGHNQSQKIEVDRTDVEIQDRAGSSRRSQWRDKVGVLSSTTGRRDIGGTNRRQNAVNHLEPSYGDAVQRTDLLPTEIANGCRKCAR